MQRLAADADDDEDIKPFRRSSTAGLAPISPGSPPVAAISSNTDTLPVTVKQLAFSAIESAVEPVKQALASTALRKAAVRSALLAVIVALSFGSAIFAYILFYYLYVPRVGFTKEIWLQYGQGVTPFAHVDLKRASLASDLVYDVILDIVAPASPRNIELGNFMVDLTLQAADGATVVRSSRAASLAWTPPVVRFLKALLRLPAFLLFDFYSHSQHIRVPIITQKALRTFTTPRISSALVQVGRPGSDGTSPGELQIYSATLRFVAHLSGLRWLMYYHRIISFFLFCGAFFTVALLSALALWVAAGFIYARESDILSEGAVPETESVTSSLDTESQDAPMLRQRQTSLKAGTEDPTRRQLEDQARRLAHARARGDAFVHSGTDTEAEDEGALAQVPLSGTASEDEAVLVKRESQSTSEESSPRWENVSTTGNDALKKEDSEDVLSVGAQRGEDASTSARLARAQSLRRRASNRSMKVEDLQ